MYQNLRALLDFQQSLRRAAQRHEAQLQAQNKRFLMNSVAQQRIDGQSESNVRPKPKVLITCTPAAQAVEGRVLAPVNKEAHDLEEFLVLGSPKTSVS